MFFLLRVAFFWLVVLLVLLPFALKGQEGRDVSVFDAFGAAQALVADARGFCARQPDACAVGGQMVTHVVEKAQSGFRWVYEFTGGAPGAGKGMAAPAAPLPATAATPAQRSGLPAALTPNDMQPVWGGGENVQPVLPPSTPAATPALPFAPTAPAAPPLPPRRPA